MSIKDGIVSIEGLPVCELKDCTNELRYVFEEHTARLEAVGARRERTDFVVFASASTPLPALARVIRDTRAAGLKIELGVVRTHEQWRPAFGPMAFLEAGVVPGAADLIATNDHERSWGGWLSAH